MKAQGTLMVLTTNENNNNAIFTIVVTWYSVRNAISESDTLHHETHWLHSGGRQAGEKDLPTKQQVKN